MLRVTFSTISLARHRLIQLVASSLSVSLLLLALAGCGPAMQVTAAETSPPRSADDLVAVDCLLPGQVIRQGRFQTWVTPPRPTKTTAGACEIQGGQYVVSDRVSRDDALRIWQDSANNGDKVAQTYIGEIYERGVGGSPDYGRAAEWYRKAADQGFARAQVNLGFLYERGLGVPRDPEAAVRWYRKAAGLPDEIKLSPGPSTELQKLQSENESLRRKLEQLEKSGQGNKQTEREQQILKQQSTVLARSFREATPTKQEVPKDLNFGSYYALVIGNSSYRDPRFDDLTTPPNDIKRLDDILRKKYGFITNPIPNATLYQIQSALLRYVNELKEDDNLLIYYSGHGEMKDNNQIGYWLPIDAPYGDFGKWFSNRQLLDYIDQIKAKHVMVIADSCYSGTMAMSSLTTFDMNMSREDRSKLIRILMERRSRSVLTAGGNNPVPERREGKYSVFARALAEALEENEGLMEGKQLYNLVAGRILLASNGRTSPLYTYLNGHEKVEFFFVPRP